MKKLYLLRQKYIFFKYARKSKELTKLETKIETNLSNHKKTLSFFENNDTCNTCTQPIRFKYLNNKNINSEANKISELEESFRTIIKRDKKNQSKIDEMII